VNDSPLQPGERRPADSGCEEMAAAMFERLSDILFGLNGAPSVEELRLRFLTPEERLRIEKEMQVEF
jgi:hypothetical protein